MSRSFPCAIVNEGQPVILIEAKWAGERLDRHDSQLFRYFGTTCAKFAILTNGITYRFYTDLDEQNKMDEKPFLDINMLNIKGSQVSELAKFQKPNFNVVAIVDTASELKYTNEIQALFAQELQEPSDELGAYFIVKMILKDAVPAQDITYKDTINYIGILYQNKVTKWICRLILNASRKIIIIPDENKKEVRYPLESIYDIEKY